MAELDPLIKQKTEKLRESLLEMDHDSLARFATAIFSYISLAHPLVWLETDLMIRRVLAEAADKRDGLPEFKA